MNTEEKTEIKFENLVKLDQRQLEQLSEGRLTFVDHPTKGQRRVDTRSAYVNTFGMEMTEEEKALFN
ncbi:hypothetical protein J1D01_11675 [Seonamhaeicola sp. NFXS20]|uniref:hypothetical protein n=1 Tax=Seonamhaeicola sp. NFXS20 TaxID=2816959 RepID=UPI003B8E294B